MKANELRLGNYVYDGEKELCKIWAVHKDRLTVEIPNDNTTFLGRYKIEYAKPIPLTEEWLLKFGFIDNDWAFINNGLELSWLIRRCESGERSCFYLSDKFPEDFQIRVEYVHTLQNLYFALTGEELEVND